MKYGYVRVSTKDQNVDRQMDAMKAEGLKEECIFVDKISGKNFDRPQYLKLASMIGEGDLIVVKSIDRLGRNYDEIKEQWAYITKYRGADIKVLDMPLLNTAVKGDLTGRLIADLVLQILAYVAQTEREFIKQRQAEGIAAARKRGVKLGRRRNPLPEGFEDVAQYFIRGELSLRKCAENMEMPPSTFYRAAREIIHKKSHIQEADKEVKE